MTQEAEREMTLHEWCAKLPKIHKVNVELRELLANQINTIGPDKVVPSSCDFCGSSDSDTNKVTSVCYPCSLRYEIDYG